MRLFIISCLLISQLQFLLGSELTLCGLFSDNMVLQDGVESKIWGTAAINSEVGLKIGTHKWTCKTDAQGTWNSKIPLLKSGPNYELHVTAGTEITIKNIAIGEVWIAGGQSNMQFRLSQDKYAAASTALLSASTDQIRWLNIPYRVSQEPLSDVNARWTVVDENSKQNMSAVAFYYAIQLQQELKKPIGIIQCCWGGTVAETWMSKQALQQDKYQALHDGWDTLLKEWYPGIDAQKVYQDKCKQWPAEREKALATGKAPPPWPSMPKGPEDANRLNALYNGMLFGITPYTIKGCIWYQGESSAYRAIQYRDLLVDLIQNWRQHWGKDMPFLMVELCSYDAEQKEPVDKHVYPVAREAQRLAAAQLENCDLISSIDLHDIDNPKDIHPKNKRDVGQRLGNLSLSTVYNIQKPYSGPRLVEHAIKDSQIMLKMVFSQKMHARGDGEITGFALAGADQQWHWATATIKGDKIVLSSDKVSNPVAAAYGWAGVPNGNLVNGDDLPAFAFRTDDWNRPTQGAVNP